MEQEKSREQQLYNEITTAIHARRKTFEKVLFGLAITQHQEDLHISYGLFKFLPHDDETLQEVTYEYPNFTVLKRVFDVSKALSLLTMMIEKQHLNFEGYPEIPLALHYSDKRFLPSFHHYGYLSCSWPAIYAAYRIDDSQRGKIPRDSLLKHDLPLYPNGTDAIADILSLQQLHDYPDVDGRIELLIPDYRARISQLHLTRNSITLDVEAGETTIGELRGKIFCISQHKTVHTTKALPVINGQITYDIETDIQRAEAYITSTTGDPIDKISFDLRYPLREQRILLEETEAQIRDIIERGENMHVEFKKTLDNEEFLETVVAFANTEGGTIFLGVDDKCRIVGFDGDVKDRIDNLIRSRCETWIGVEYISLKVEGKPIVMIKVSAGNDIYSILDRGIFVRRGSSDRQIRMVELTELFEKRRKGSFLPRTTSWL